MDRSSKTRPLSTKQALFVDRANKTVKFVKIMKSYLRFLGRNKVYTAIMAVGLSVALTFVIVFTCYLKQQLEVGYHYPDSDLIYIVGMEGTAASNSRMWTMFAENIPELEGVVGGEIAIGGMKYNGETASNRLTLYTNSDFFKMFQTRMVAGKIEDFEPKRSAFVTESFARRNGMEEIIGKQLIPSQMGWLATDDESESYIIAGIIEDFTNTIFPDFEIVANFDERKSSVSSQGNGILTFIKVKEGTDIDLLTQKLTDVYNDGLNLKRTLVLERLDRLYFSEFGANSVAMKKENGDRLTVFVLVVFFLLVSAIFNYINLSVANAERRAKELGIRRVVGESRGRIIFRTFIESLAFTTVSFVIALAATSLVTDWINYLLQSPVPISVSFTPDYIFIYILIIVTIAAICGIAVSAATSDYKVRSSTVAGKSLSRLFIVIQFILSFIMISVSITMETQMKYMVYRDMNVNIDNIYFTNASDHSSFNGLKEKIEALPFVRRIGVTSGYPGWVFAKFDDISWLSCDTTAFQMFGFEIVEDFGKADPYGKWISESIANRYGVNSENQEIVSNDPAVSLFRGNIAGIIKDFPSSNLLRTDLEASPFVSVENTPSIAGWMILDVEETKEHREILDSLISTTVFNSLGKEITGHGFIRDLTKDQYEQTRKDMRMIELFMFIAIILSSLAFLAMSMQYANRSTRQIAVHKVFGGTTQSELVRNMVIYFKIMGVATIVAMPASIWICGRYLEQFTYRFTFAEKWWIFPASLLITLTISTLTVLWQTLRASRTNPSEALKKE